MRSFLFFRLITIALLFLISIAGCHQYSKAAIKGDDLSLKIITITQDHIQTIQQGSRLLILIPTDEFFEPLETNLKPRRINPILHMANYAARYSRTYPNATVYVRGYADPIFPPYSPLILSQQYADTIAAYLWSAGIPLNHIQSVGYGNRYPIANPETVPGRGYNRRVEIQIN